MPNMDYCRFRNTLYDLDECCDAMDEGDLSSEESRARTELISLCVSIACAYGDEVNEPCERVRSESAHLFE